MKTKQDRMPENTKLNSSNIFEFDKLWDYDNPAETEKKFKELLPAVKGFGQ
ncbi:MAG: hypothetical protein IPL53_00945 [Ignavibacteria bacterium]|nr:hypothetical protein [Ignavibacteria bacterium]